jgi:hypothetical protein
VGWDFFVSAGVHTPAEMLRSGNKVNKQVAKRIANFRFDLLLKQKKSYVN